jgi:hypothetical protein
MKRGLIYQQLNISGAALRGYGQTRSAVDGLIGVRRLILASRFPFFTLTFGISP